LNGNTHTITDSGDQLTVGQTSTGGGSLTKGTTNNMVMVLDLTSDNDSVTLSDLVVTRTGGAVDGDTDASGIKLWHDVNDDNAWDAGDAQLSTSKTFSGGSVTFDTIGFTTTAGTPEKLLITYDIASGAADTTIGAQIDSAAQVTVGSPDSAVLSATPLTGDSFTLTDPAGDTLTASANVVEQTLDPSAGQADVVMHYFQVDSDSAGDGSLELSAITVNDLGTAGSGDWDALEIYIDDDPAFDNPALIGQVLSWNGASTSVPLTQGTAADRTVTAGTPKFIFVVYDINTGAAGQTIQSQVTIVDVQSPDNGHSGFDFRSADPALTIQEASADSTTVESNAAVRSSCRQITVTSFFKGDANEDGDTLVEFNTANDFTGGQSVACPAASGPSPRRCLITGDSVAQLSADDYWIQVTHSDPDTVLGGTNPEVLGPVSLEACGTDSSAPTVVILAPARDAVLGGTDRVKVQVYDEVGLAGTDPVKWSVDGAVVAATGVTDNANYQGDYCTAPQCRVYEFDLNTTGLADGEHYLTVEVTDAATPTANVAVVRRGFRSRNQGASNPGGSGLLLRRTSGSQLCTDCHNLPTHSSQTTSTDYGNWAVECLDCHTPHSTQNIFLVRKSLRTPKSGTKTVNFHYDDDQIGGEDNPGDVGGDNPTRLSFLGDRSASDGGTPNAPFDDGICEACHTKTKFWRNTVDADHTHNAGTRCMKCHGHDAGFSGGGGGCLGCHSNVGDIGVGGTNNRRPVLANFDNFTGGAEPRSHHVGNSGTNMGGELTDHDCVVCHAEGRVNSVSGETETVAAFHGGDTGGDTAINLKNVDTWDDDSPSASAMFTYDKEATGMPSPASPATWNSSNAEWRNQTSQALDPFCLTCHDTDGAVTAFNSTDSGSALNPFGDLAITNEYDQVPRDYAVPPVAPGRVVDIKSMVTAGATDLDTDAGRLAQGIPDPTEGIYSRHAIRGQALSTYVDYQSIGGANDYTMYEGDPTAGQSLLTSMGSGGLECDHGGDGTALGRACTVDGDCTAIAGAGATCLDMGPLWNDTSVMGCADCHTTDGANGSAGNAHGSDSEYLLKDASGLATEGVYDSQNNTFTYVCYRCHEVERYQNGGTLGDHTPSSSDWQDKVALTGSARRDDGKGSNIFGMACANCHGGTGPESNGSVMWGTIHGSSEVFVNGTSGTRNAYRFMNGASLRFYDPQGWTGTAVTCYTLSSADDWGGCTKHGSAQNFQGGKPLQRPIAY
jgi:hypothetical protein